MAVRRITAVMVPATLLAVAAWGATATTAEAARRHPVPSSSGSASPSPSSTATAPPSPSASTTAQPSPSPSPSGTTTAATGQTVYVADYGTSAAAVQNAMNAAQGATLVFPSGVVYSVTQPLSLPAGVTVVGNQSVLRTPDNSTSSTSDDAILYTGRSDQVSGLVFDGNIQNQGGVWTQHRHAVRVIGGSSVSLSGNTFRNLIGDGVYVGGGASGLAINHNTFYGDHTNRNGVSIVSASNVDVHDNVFNSMSRPDMPGAVDLEPNPGGDALTNIQVHNNTVNDPAKYGLLLWNTAGAAISGVAFHDNTVNGGSGDVDGGAAIMVGYGPASVYGNTVQNVPKFNGIELDDGASATVTNNTINGAWDGLNNWQACLSQSGNIFQNIANTNVATYSPTC